MLYRLYNKPFELPTAFNPLLRTEGGVTDTTELNQTIQVPRQSGWDAGRYRKGTPKGYASCCTLAWYRRMRLGHDLDTSTYSWNSMWTAWAPVQRVS